MSKPRKVVTLVFDDASTMEVNTIEAIRICREPGFAGHIIDALTPDKSLQDSLRRLMDITGKPD